MTHTRRTVCIDQIMIDGYYQFRPIDTQHADALAVTIRQTEQPLDPVIVWQTEEGMILLDGAHRLTAYKSARWEGEIPAIVYTGIDQRRALGIAIKANSKRSLQMSREDCLNAAWRLVREPVQPRYKAKEITVLTGIGRRTVDNMRARLKTIDPDAITGSWRRDLKDHHTDTSFGMMTPDQRDAGVRSFGLSLRDFCDRRKHKDIPILRDGDAVCEAVIFAFGDRWVEYLWDYYSGGRGDCPVRREVQQNRRDDMDRESPF